MKTHFLVVLGILLLALQGCRRRVTTPVSNGTALPKPTSSVSTPITISNDTWYSPAPKGSIPAEWGQLDGTKVSEVANDMLPAAERSLSEQKIIPITVEKAKEFSTNPVLCASGERPYLVRAVYLNGDTGAFEVFQQGQNVWIYHSSLGQAATAMKRNALVISLPFYPDQVFVDCSLAE